MAALVFGGRAEAASADVSTRAVTRALRWVGLKSLRQVRRDAQDDCVGLALLAYKQQDLNLIPDRLLPNEGGVGAIHRRARALKALKAQPAPGDLVFFRQTYDRNRDGRLNDGLTHVGVVESVDEEGTVTFIHRVGGGVKRGHLNVRNPHARKDAEGHVLNDWLRNAQGKAPARLTGELFAGYASVDDRWVVQPRPSRPRLARATPVRR